MVIGWVRQIWRYPVKSMGGERMTHATVTTGGVVGDRQWAVRDERAGEIRGAKHLPALMQCSARYRRPPTTTDIAPVDITLCDGTQIGSDDAAVNDRLSDEVGRRVSLWPVRPSTDKRHYRRAQFGASVLGWATRSDLVRRIVGGVIRAGVMDASTRELFGRENGEPLPDLSLFPADVFGFTSPPGTYFDAFALHMLTTASLEAMRQKNGACDWDVRRFRPNILVETAPGDDGFVEAGWSRWTLQVGTVQIRHEIPSARCGMTSHAQPGLQKDPAILRTIVREADQNLGCYATPLNAGSIGVDDVVSRIE